MTTSQITQAPPVTDPAKITDEIRDAAADHSERRARALIAAGLDDNSAVAQAADEAVQFTRRTVQIAHQCRALVELVDAYSHYGKGNTYRLLRDVGDHLNRSIAYVDRATIEAHLERNLSVGEWAATSSSSTPWISTTTSATPAPSARTGSRLRLVKARVPGYGYTASGEVA
jgi:hypothetical protein